MLSLQGLIFILTSGLAMGFIYALISLGITLVWKSASVVNFAQGDFCTIGMYMLLTFWLFLKWPLLLSLAIAILTPTFFGFVMEILAIRPVIGADPNDTVIVTLGVSIFISQTVRRVWGPIPRIMPSFLGDVPYAIGFIALTPEKVWTMVVCLAIVLVLHFFFQKTYVGTALRAVAEDREVAKIVGIDVKKMTAIAFTLSSCLAGIAGVLIAPILVINPDIGIVVVIKSFMGAIIGGFGSYPGALIGGILIGLIDNLGSALVSMVWKDVILYVTFILIILFRPHGLLGRKS